jgi:hypothetical protein
VPLAAAPRTERVGLGVLLAGAIAVVVGTFLPWLRSGTVWRTSYEVWRSADRLGVIEGTGAELLQAAWFLLPLGAGCLVVAVALDRARLSSAIAAVIGVLAVTGATVALLAPLPTGAGPVVTAVGGGIALGGASATLVARRRTSRG